MGDGGNLPQSLPFDFKKYNKRTKEQSEGQGNKKEERKRKEGCTELEQWETNIHCNQKLRGIRANSGVHPQS